jgi:hypothetical protein
MKNITNFIVVLFLLGCISAPKQKIDDLILGKWKGYECDGYEMSIEFLGDSVIIGSSLSYPVKNKYSIKNDTLYLDGYEDSKIILNKNTLTLNPLPEDSLRVSIAMIHIIMFKRE